MDYGIRSGKSLSLEMPMAPQDNPRTTKSLSLWMPQKASPLSSSSIGNFTWSYIFIRHMICVWSVLYDISLCFLVFHNHHCCTHLLGETHLIGIYQNTLCASLISFELDSFALVLHLYLLEHGSGLILQKLLISHDSLILF